MPFNFNTEKDEYMLKREITYEDFNGDTVTEVFYFNISKPELIELEVEYKQGLSGLIKEIISAQDSKELIMLFKRLILLAYGEKSSDGKRFIKSDELRESFSQTAAYQSLFMELATSDGAAIHFLQGIIPKDMVGDMNEALNKGQTASIPKPPANV